MADELLHVVEQASTPTVCLGALHAPEPKVLAANAIRRLWMLPHHRVGRITSHASAQPQLHSIAVLDIDGELLRFLLNRRTRQTGTTA